MSYPTPNWLPYRLAATPERPRSLATVEGLGDRLRFVAFAEKQAAEAFRMAAERFHDAPEGLCQAWLKIAEDEDRHQNLLLERMAELGQQIHERAVALDLWLSFEHCEGAEQFTRYMAQAEERGRVAGDRFAQVLSDRDKRSAEIFALIAQEEREHIALVERFFW